MTKSKNDSLPSSEDLLAIINSEDFFLLAVKGHQFINDILNEIIDELLYDSHALELKRLSLLLKVDLCISLGQFPREIRNLFVRLNNVRNQFAHNRKASLDISKAHEIFDMLPKGVQDFARELNNNSMDSLNILQVAIASLYLSLEKTLEGIRKRKLRGKVAWDLVEERIPDIWEPREGISWIDEEIEKRVKKILDANSHNN